MTLFFHDWEFIEDGKTISPISIGMVSSDGREYYAQSCEFDMHKASPWVAEHVFPELDTCPLPWGNHQTEEMYQRLTREIPLHKFGQCWDMHGHFISMCPWRTRWQIAQEVCRFISINDGTIELWGYYSSFDHVALAWLYGPMINLPEGWPMITYDIKQYCKMLGNPRLPEQGKGEHHALQDAKWVRTAHEFLEGLVHE